MILVQTCVMSLLFSPYLLPSRLGEAAGVESGGPPDRGALGGEDMGREGEGRRGEERGGGIQSL